MGMDVVLRTLQKYGGDVLVKSQLGVGTVIELKLPKGSLPEVPQ